MNDRKYEVEFRVEEHQDAETEVVTIEDGTVDGADPEQRAVVAAASISPYSHIETLAIQEVESNG